MYGNPYGNMHANPNMAMNMNMGGMGMMPMMGGTGGLFNNMFMYSGNAIGLQSRLESLNPTETANIREATINCTGTQISEMNMMCLICTICWGSFLIFPLCFMCCDWWMRMTYPSFDVPESTYRALQNLILGSPLQTLSMTVTDNRLGAQKAQILYDILSRSQLKGFTLVNGAGHYDLDNNEYSNFVENMRVLKKLPISS